MEYSLRESILMGLSLLAAALLIYMSVPMAHMAQEAGNQYMAARAEAMALAEEREWLKYTGTVSGASMLGFIIRHKNSCDIVIRNNIWDARITPFLRDSTLTLGLSAKVAIPDSFWETTFLYDVLLGGHGEREYTAKLIYNGDTIIGINYEEV